MIYQYRCKCGLEEEVMMSVRDHTNRIPCNGCGGVMKQVITAPRVIPDIDPYRSVVTGERIKGRAHHRQHLKDHGLIEVGNENIERKETPLPDVVPDIKRALQEVGSK